MCPMEEIDKKLMKSIINTTPNEHLHYLKSPNKLILCDF